MPGSRRLLKKPKSYSIRFFFFLNRKKKNPSTDESQVGADLSALSGDESCWPGTEADSQAAPPTGDFGPSGGFAYSPANSLPPLVS